MPLKVFVAEDSAADLFWLEMVFKNTGLDYTLAVVADGEAAKEYLWHHTNADPDVPDLVFLDLNMPRLTALEVLRQLPATEQLPFCILTGSTTEKEQVCEELGELACRYILKPLTQAKLVDCLQCFEPLRTLAEEMTHRVAMVRSDEPRLQALGTIAPCPWDQNTVQQSVRFCPDLLVTKAK